MNDDPYSKQNTAPTEIMVLKGLLLLILTIIAFVGGIDIIKAYQSQWLWCPQIRRSACDPESIFKGKMDALKGEVKHRAKHVRKLKNLQKKIDEYQEPAISRRQSSREHPTPQRTTEVTPATPQLPYLLTSYTPTQDVENDMKALHSKGNDLDKEMKEILSFLTDNEFDEDPKTTQPFYLRLIDKSQGVVKLEDIGKLEDRMTKMEERLSKLTDSDTLNDIEYMDKLLENTVNEFTPKMNKLDTVESEIREVDVINTQVSNLNQSYTGTAQKLQDLRGTSFDAYRQGVKLQRNFRTFSPDNEKFEKGLEDFIEDWTKNCSRSENPCLSFTEEHLRFLRITNGSHSNTLVEKTVTPLVLGSLFWGCSPIVPETFPNLKIRRHSKEKMITFSCSEDKVLIGPKYILCRNRKWRPYTKPICKSRYTSLAIPSCPEIRLDANSSLIIEVNEEMQLVTFDCPEGQALRGSSVFWCRKGSWYPKIDPTTECYKL